MLNWKPAEKLRQPILTAPVCSVESADIVVAEPPAAILPSLQKVSAPVSLPEAEKVVSADSHLSYSEPPPQLGERYDVLEHIGSGGMGTVWKVYDKSLKETFAIKVLKPELVADATAVKRFEKEANLASDLTHANIAAIFGPGADSEGRPYIIMRYVDGESLADILLAEGKLSEERALDIFTQICEALAHSHMKGIIHRDIKPSNIIISKTESGGDMVHVVDFGIARCVYDEVTKTQALTKAVDVFGSPRYMSPEQFLGKDVTGQSDIYSLGCVLYEMLTGAPPFTDENPVRLILQHISEAPDLSRIPIKLTTVLVLCFGKEPESRTPNVERLLETLSTLHLRPPINAQTTNIIHCMIAVLIILFSGMSAMDGHASLPSMDWLVLFAMWIYIAVVNRENAGRSVNYKILEVTALLCAISAAIIDCLSLFQVPYLGLLFMPFCAAGTCWLILQPRTIEIYSNLSKKISALSLRQSRPQHLKHQKSFYKADKLFTNTAEVFGFAVSGAMVFLPVVTLVCGSDLGLSWMSLAAVFPVAMIVYISFMVTLMVLMDDVLFCQKSARKSLEYSFKLQAVFLLIGVVSTLAFTSTVGRNGFNQFARQLLLKEATKARQETVSMEALTYPDTFFANKARLLAADTLVDQRGHKSDVIAISNQILESKKERDAITLASAHKLRAQAAGRKELQSANVDLDAALIFLERAKVHSSAGLEAKALSLVFSDQIDEALAIGNLAIDRKNILRATRALEIAKQQKLFGIQCSGRAVKNLEKKIDALKAEDE